ncbi:MAG TPA: hypothetical protein VGJ48_01260 [Pyrinomonadaceae bacterium]|jgi:hypothetical protein
MSDCCSVPGSTEACAIVVDKEIPNADSRCSTCEKEGRPVERQTVFHHVKHEQLDRVNGEAYRFCAEPTCPIVYYGDEGTRFTVDDVRELVTTKTQGDARPICYCFGFSEGDARKEIERTGQSKIPERVSGLIKAGMCACEVRNPAGVCCLGEVNQTVKRFSAQHKSSVQIIGVSGWRENST